MSATRVHARPREETSPARPMGQRWGLGVVAALLPLAGLALQVRQALLHPLAARVLTPAR